MKVACIIPARLYSQRFPQKILATLKGKPLLQWVYEAACQCDYFSEIIFAVDAQITKELVTSFDAKVVMTPTSCVSGTDRLIEVVKRGSVRADYYVNWQADEPFISKTMIQDLFSWEDKGRPMIASLMHKINISEDLYDPQCVKVVTNRDDKALYFSRAPIPFISTSHQNHVMKQFYKHIGLYAFSHDVIQVIDDLPGCFIEQQENLEQLRFLFGGLNIQMSITEEESIGIDTPKDLERAERFLESTKTCS